MQTEDPCEKCIISMICTKTFHKGSMCVEKLLYIHHNNLKFDHPLDHIMYYMARNSVEEEKQAENKK